MTTMKVRSKFEQKAPFRARIHNRKDPDNYTTYGSVEYITEEIDNEYSRYYVLHHDSGETSTFSADEWELRVEVFVPLW